MPSFICGNISGGINIISGFGSLFSGGSAAGVVGGIQIVLSPAASGNAYIGLSGGITINSGGLNNFSGALDGVLVPPGGGYFVPKIGLGGTGPNSGNPTVYVAVDSAASGQARLYWQTF